jgi:hypothetical protein
MQSFNFSFKVLSMIALTLLGKNLSNRYYTFSLSKATIDMCFLLTP